MGKSELDAGEQTSSLPSSAHSTAKEAEASYEAVDGRNGSAALADSKELGASVTVARDEEAAAAGEDEVDYPTSWKLLLITLALCLSVFCMALDNTIIAVAIPKITDHFKALDDVGWYGSSYLLTTCAFQLMFGKLYTFYSIKWIYLGTLFIFELGSLICGVAPTSEALIVGRAIAGIGAGGIFSGAVLIIAHTVPLVKRPTYTGLIGAMYGIASVAGPLMGGAFTDKLTWRWCFYINLPFGAVTAFFIIFFFTSPKRQKASQKGWKEQLNVMDPIGTFFFIPSAISLLLALQWGGAKYDWGNARIIVLFIIAGLCGIAFLAVQHWKQEDATVPPRVFFNRNVWGSALFGAALGGAFFVMVFYLPIWFQAIKGVSAVKSGIMSLPMLLGLVIISVVGGATVTVIGYYTPFMLVSSVLMSVGAGLLTTFTPHTGHPEWIGYQFIFGAGVGFGMQQTLMAVQTALPLVDVPVGTAIIMFAQMLGGALFISVAQNIFQNQLIKNLAAQIPNFPQITSLVLETGATSIKAKITGDRRYHNYLGRVLQAYNDALTETWYVSVAMAALSIVGAAFVQWKSVKDEPVKVVVAQEAVHGTVPLEAAVLEEGEDITEPRVPSAK